MEKRDLGTADQVEVERTLTQVAKDATLTDGAVIRIGNTTLTFHQRSDA